MKKLLLLLLSTPFLMSGQDNGRLCESLSKINLLVQEEHYSPKPVDDSLSVYVFDAFVDGLDANRNLFTKMEYESLCRHRLQLDDDILGNDCSFMGDFVATYRHALERKRSIIEEIKKNPLDYKSMDSVRFSKENFPFDLSEADLEKVWKKRIRFEILEDISKLGNNADSLQQHFAELEKASRAKVFDTDLCQVNSLLDNKKGLYSALSSDFLNIFCNYFDPHSNYFSPDAKSSFMSSLSTDNLSLGLSVSLNEKEEIIVEEVLPGGPAALTEKFEKDDIIVRVANKKGEEYWVSCASLETIGSFLFSDANKEVELTIRKKNGALLDVSLEKKVMKASENSVYSFIAEKDARVGYINIPNFYSDFDSSAEHGCAEDVAKEIEKLVKEHIDGLVIDLQDNGGGSMEEAIKLAGMFIDHGPVSILVNSRMRQMVLRDNTPGSVYSGPVVLLINSGSASASEFFSSALQDYNRAIVIGSASLGKATMQTIMPLDEKNEDEFVKLSIQKFFRISGDSNQIKGVIPNVRLPVLFDSIAPRESSYRTALPYSTIDSKVHYSKFNPDKNRKAILLSIERTKTNPRFMEMEQLNAEINAVYNKQRPPVILQFCDVFSDIHEIDPLWDKVKEITSRPTGAKIFNTADDQKELLADAVAAQVNSYKMTNARNNPYLEEAINIIRDYTRLKK